MCGQHARMSLCQQRVLRQLEAWRKLFAACNQVSAGTLSLPHWARHGAQELETGREFPTSSQARSREVQRCSWALMGHKASSEAQSHSSCQAHPHLPCTIQIIQQRGGDLSQQLLSKRQGKCKGTLRPNFSFPGQALRTRGEATWAKAPRQ